MNYTSFQDKVSCLIERVGKGLSVVFQKDEDNGRFIARISDGTTIIGNETCKRVSVTWGTGHSAMAAI